MTRKHRRYIMLGMNETIAEALEDDFSAKIGVGVSGVERDKAANTATARVEITIDMMSGPTLYLRHLLAITKALGVEDCLVEASGYTDSGFLRMDECEITLDLVEFDVTRWMPK